MFNKEDASATILKIGFESAVVCIFLDTIFLMIK